MLTSELTDLGTRLPSQVLGLHHDEEGFKIAEEWLGRSGNVVWGHWTPGPEVLREVLCTIRQGVSKTTPPLRVSCF